VPSLEVDLIEKSLLGEEAPSLIFRVPRIWSELCRELRLEISLVRKSWSEKYYFELSVLIHRFQ
jgi:hypothetical protein